MAAAVLVTGAAVPANASGDINGTTTTSHSSPDLEERFDRIGVAQEDRAELAAKLDSGQLWDSMSGVAPASTETYTEGGRDFIRTTFPDGSIVLNSMEQPTATAPTGTIGVFAKPLSGCVAIPSSGGWTRRANCYTDADYGTYKLSFMVDYSVKSGGGRIDKAFNKSCEVLPTFNYKSCDLVVNRKTNSGAAAAQARLTGVIKNNILGTEINVWLQVEAYGSAWSTNK